MRLLIVVGIIAALIFAFMPRSKPPREHIRYCMHPHGYFEPCRDNPYGSFA